MGKIFYMRRRTVENLNAHIDGTTLIKWQFISSLMNIRICLIPLLWISEWTLYWSIFLTTKHNNKKLYWGWRGKMFNALNGYLHEFLEFVIILIAFFVTWKYLYYMENYPRKWCHNSYSSESKHSRPSQSFGKSLPDNFSNIMCFQQLFEGTWYKIYRQ